MLDALLARLDVHSLLPHCEVPHLRSGWLQYLAE